MNHMLVIMLVLIVCACSSSSEDNTNPLAGTWLSNCHARNDSNGVFIAYSIISIIITDNMSSTTTTEYTDSSCTISNGTTFTLDENYTLGEQVTTTDGVEAQRITFKSEYILFAQPIIASREMVYRITGVELYFGDYTNDTTPSLDYAVTYIKQ